MPVTRRFPSPRVVAALPTRNDQLLLGGIFMLALALRLIQLGEKPLHHDESVHAWIAWLLYTGEGYRYDPTYHGPFQFVLYAASYFLFGVGDTAVRAFPVLIGAGITLLPWFLRDQLGRTAALTASFLLAISPSYLYFSRFTREDITVAAITLGLIVLVFRFLAAPRRWHPAAIFGLLALSFATKETTYISVFIAGTFFVAATAIELVRTRRSPRSRAIILPALRAPGAAGWAWAATAFALVFTVLFTTFLFNPQGLRDGLTDSLEYWLSQHEVQRGGQPWFYYLVLLPLYELPIVVLGIVGVAVALRRRTLLRLFLVYDFVLSLVVYSWAGERMPWLILHPLLPLILLAGIGAEATWSAARGHRRTKFVAIGASVIGLAVLVHGATAVAYDHPADPAEPLVFTQNSTDVLGVRNAVRAIDRQVMSTTGEHARIVADSSGGVSWPWAWYFRDLPVQHADMAGSPDLSGADVVLVVDWNDDRVRPLLRDYARTRFRLREWWVIDYGAARPRSVWRWFLEREPWGERGSLNEWLYVRRSRLEAPIVPALGT